MAINLEAIADRNISSIRSAVEERSKLKGCQTLRTRRGVGAKVTLTKPSLLSRIAFQIEWWVRGSAALLLADGCAWQPVMHSYASGLIIARVDQDTLDRVCSHTSDEGYYIKHASGCYDAKKDVIYILNNAAGAKALPHELAHRDGIEKPKAQGYSW